MASLSVSGALRARNLMYISPGNIPSRWAHTFQVMKQAEAFSGLFREFSVVISRGLVPSAIDSVNLQEWYGLRRTFRIIRLPVAWRVKEPYFSAHRLPAFDRIASCYARLRSPDVVYTRSPGVARRCISLRLPTIFETHAPGMYDIEHLLPVVNRTAFLGIVTVTEALKQNYAESGIPAHRILVEPDAIDLDRFRDCVDQQTARKELGLPESKPIAMYCGHLYPEKGVEVAIEAADLCPDVEFWFVGGWREDIEKMKGLSASLGNVHFAGFVSNEKIPVWLAAADFLLLPNSGKTDHAKFTSPLKWYEYMAAGKPVIASDIPALRDLAKHESNAYLVPADSSKRLAEAVTSLSMDASLATRIGAQARREVVNHTWINRAHRIIQSFQLITD